MKQFIKGTLMVFGIIFIIFMVDAFLSVDQEPEQTSPYMKDDLREGFMDACVESNMMYHDYCDCTYSYLELSVGRGEIIRAGLTLTGDEEFYELPIPMQEAVEYCLDEL